MLDADLCGPSIPRLLGSQGQSVSQGPAGWIPVKAACEPKICSISMEFLVQGADEAVVWRGPKKTGISVIFTDKSLIKYKIAMIRQMIGGVDWSDVDLLIVDTPPGTSDEHISLVETLKASPDRKFSSPSSMLCNLKFNRIIEIKL